MEIDPGMDFSPQPASNENGRPYVVVLGNEKGGTGKSTTAMHLAIALLGLDYRVGTIDADARQQSLTRYLENREARAAATGQALRLPRHHCLQRVGEDDRSARQQVQEKAVEKAFAELAACEIVIVDTPGSSTHYSRLVHMRADTLVTPINDSYLDIDVLARIDPERRQALAPSSYTRFVWEQNNRRVVDGLAPIDWIVMRNRLTHIEARNKRDIHDLMEKLAQRIGFRIAPGFGERVIYRELFLQGLTLLDLPLGEKDPRALTSHQAARREIDALLRAIGVLQPATRR
jgi:chromosome partitioning protein